MSEAENEKAEGPEFIRRAREALVEGDRLAQQEKPDLEQALAKYDEAVSILTENGGMNMPQGLYLMAGAQMNRGNLFAAVNSPDMTRRAIAAYRSAIDCFRGLPPTQDERYFLDLASLWANLAQVLIRLQTVDGLAEATECFDKAIETIQKLPWRENESLRAHLIGLWLNKGNAHQMLRAKESRVTAIDAYDTAIELAQPLALSDRKNGALLSTVWLNRGNTLRANGDEESLFGALESYDESIRILQELDTAENRQLALTCANALASKAMILAGYQQKPDCLAKSEKAAREAIASIGEDEKRHPVPAEISLNARQALCQAACSQLSSNTGDDPEEHYNNATDAVDESLELIRHWEDRKVPNFRNIARRMFRLGAQLYAAQQPHFLAEFILENLTGESVEAHFGKDPEMLSVGVGALKNAVQILEKQMEQMGSEQRDEADRLKGELRASLAQVDPLAKKAESERESS